MFRVVTNGRVYIEPTIFCLAILFRSFKSEEQVSCDSPLALEVMKWQESAVKPDHKNIVLAKHSQSGGDRAKARCERREKSKIEREAMREADKAAEEALERVLTEVRKANITRLVEILNQAMADIESATSVEHLARIIRETRCEPRTSVPNSLNVQCIADLSARDISSMINELNDDHTAPRIKSAKKIKILADLAPANIPLIKQILEAFLRVHRDQEWLMPKMISRGISVFDHLRVKVQELSDASREFKQLQLFFQLESNRILLNIFTIQREAEMNRHKRTPKSQMRLFFHGTWTDRLFSILKQGLRSKSQFAKDPRGVFATGSASCAEAHCSPAFTSVAPSRERFMLVFETRERDYKIHTCFQSSSPHNERLEDGTLLPQFRERLIYVPKEKKIVLRYLIRFI